MFFFCSTGVCRVIKGVNWWGRMRGCALESLVNSGTVKDLLYFNPISLAISFTRMICFVLFT